MYRLKGLRTVALHIAAHETAGQLFRLFFSWIFFFPSFFSPPSLFKLLKPRNLGTFWHLEKRLIFIQLKMIKKKKIWYLFLEYSNTWKWILHLWYRDVKTVLKGYSVRKLTSKRKHGGFLSEDNSGVCYQGTASPASVSFLCAVNPASSTKSELSQTMLPPNVFHKIVVCPVI